MINKEDFIKNFKNQLFDAPEQLDMNTKFRDLETWDSLTAMAVIVMIEDEYSIKISDEQFMQMQTLEDIYNSINK